uniref:Integrase, catalytic region, zinc finger, CCHC-type, peptidase aspartic, catalytic n=1 Tax=Tanacetum cinerariifolium TaxID=118510 RepID=A0A6L2N2F7_TANCI|nr:integrase, catalytic region, zinc finger, CCHC-type, peptidase aspartic, catalytic [Tanacetum cinerariifolium]
MIGYSDYQIGNVTISGVYYVERLGHNLSSVGQLCDADLEVSFRKHSYFVRDLDGVDLLKGSLGSNFMVMASSSVSLKLWYHQSTAKEGLVKDKIDHGDNSCRFDELTAMASEQFGSGPTLQLLTPGYISSGLVQNPVSPTPYVSPSKKD